MAYDYETQKAVVFTPDGLKMILKIQATADDGGRAEGARVSQVLKGAT